METYLDLDKWIPEKLTMKINDKIYDVKDITVELFLEILSLCELGIGQDPNLVKFTNQVRKVAKVSFLKCRLENIKRLLRRGRPISEGTGQKKLARFIQKMVPALPWEIVKSMSQKQIQGFLEFLIQSYYEGQSDPNFLRPMSKI
jgi:hypothetical protein